MATVLVVGSGGREHALAWGLARSAAVDRVIVLPGNGGTAAFAPARPVDADDLDAVVAFAVAEACDLVVVGPEAPLVAGLVDTLSAAGVLAFGPVAACARLEGSKAFAKAMMDRCGVPTARWGTFTSAAEALAWHDRVDFPVVVKASGLAAGKGVVVPDTAEEARAAIVEMFDGAFGSAGAEVVLEERLIGEEASLLAVCDGTRYAVLPAAQDHKRVGEGDTGPNTGGMGAYSPAPVVAGQEAALAEAVIAPILAAFAADGTPFRGVLYAGLMMTADGPRVLEYNTRFGDPETQVLVPRIASDLYELFVAAASGTLDPASLRIRAEAAATVVAASEGYPGAYPKGRPISGVDAAGALGDVVVFHAGTALRGDTLVTAGGRVLTVTGLGTDLREALSRAYAGLDRITFDGMHARRDIGWRALDRSSS